MQHNFRRVGEFDTLYISFNFFQNYFFLPQSFDWIMINAEIWLS